MNLEIANALSGYIETLYNLNINLIKLCGLDIMTGDACNEKEILDIIQEIPRIVPYSIVRNTQKLKYEKRDGLLEYGDEIDYLKKYYDIILEDNNDFLFKIKQIRNKHEHKMQYIDCLSSYSCSTTLFSFTFQIEGEVITVNANEFIKLTKELNMLFSKIVKDIRAFACENQNTTYALYSKIIRFDFEDFNLLYECELLKKIGRIMYEF